MIRHVLTVDLRDDPAAIESYKAHHRRVWPEVVRSLQRAGIREMEIYLLGRRLVMVVDTEGADFRRCFQVMECDDRTLLEQWMASWRDLVDFEVIPVQTSADAAAAIAPRL